jgi:hypothetical protein
MRYSSQREAGYLFHEFRDLQGDDQLPSELIEGAKFCADSAFGRIVGTDALSRSITGDQVIIAEDVLLRRGQVTGFSNARIISPREQFEDDSFSDEPGLYLAGSAIRAEAQSSGLYRLLLQRRLKLAQELNLNTIFTTSQNPRVQEAVTKSLEELVIQEELRGFKLGSVMVKGFYGRMITAREPKARETTFSELDYAAGDAFRLIWDLDRS